MPYNFRNIPSSSRNYSVAEEDFFRRDLENAFLELSYFINEATGLSAGSSSLSSKRESLLSREISVKTYSQEGTTSTIASATTISVPYMTEILFVTGSTAVVTINGGVTVGDRITLVWASSADFDVTNSTGNIELNGGSDITSATANSPLSLLWDGSNWLETGRSIT